MRHRSELPVRSDQATEPDPLAAFQEPVRRWFSSSFGEPTLAQRRGWPPILAGDSTLLLAPTGSGKTLAAFLAAIDRLMFDAAVRPRSAPVKRGGRARRAASEDGCRVLYVSPLKALAVDVERNLRAPLAGIAATAERDGIPFRVPTVAVRSGDTPASDRARMGRQPPDILITTPESLYLMLTSSARDILAHVETIIIDEIHSLVASKRGAHLFVSLERLALARAKNAPPIQRIGLSATQRPLGEVARLLGGAEVEPGETSWRARPVTTVDAGTRKAWRLTVEVPVDDMSRLGEPMDEIQSGPAAAGPARRSIWPSIHPRLIELIRAHRSTMIFANSRRLAERLSAALNELAGEELVLAHHGSVARERRAEIEDRLKRGTLPAIVATSTMELGIDMGAVDLVVQIESPPSVASGIQRIGRAGHSVGAVSEGVIFPKYRGDLLACAAATARMREGIVEETLYPRNPLDVLAQQLVAIAGMDPIDVDALYALVRRAAPFAELPRSSFEGVLDMLSGRYPSDEFAELRPRLVWDRVGGTVRGREGVRRLAVVSGGTIPDRGLYGVYLAGADDGGRRGSRRVGELDEEMVFESRTGDVFLLGASSWRIEEITHDRVLVSPAPGQPGKMPFWHGDRAGRPIEFGRAIGQLSRELLAAPRDRATARLRDDHGLDERAAANLIGYLEEQAQATGDVPSDRTVVIERTTDELGSYRVCVLSPFGARVHAPWANAVLAQWRANNPAGTPGRDLEVIWSDDGIAFRLPEAEEMPSAELFLPPADEVEDLVVQGLGATSLFAARFRENAARALLLPRRFPGHRTPLWAQRKRAADLLAVASRYGSFPILLETYRECLRDVFDLPSLVDLLRRISTRQVRVVTVDSDKPSPFAASLLFSWVASFIYDGDAPLAERRAQALAVDTAELRELLGEAEMRELLDPDALADIERHLQHLDGKRLARSTDGLHDLLLSLGDLGVDEIRARSESPESVDAWVADLVRDRRAIEVSIAGERRIAAAEDAARLRDALGVVPPRGLPDALLAPVADPLGDLCSRYARTHGPFPIAALATRLGLGIAPVRAALEHLAERGRVLEGEFAPGGHGREWCDAEVLRSLKRRSLAKLRQEVEPVEPAALGRMALEWQGIRRPRTGLDALLSVVEQLQGAPIVASLLEMDVLPARIDRYRPADLDQLCAAGEVVWSGVEPLGPNDGRIALYLTDQLPLLAPGATAEPPADTADLAARVRALLSERGALFFADLLTDTGAFAPELLSTLWDLVWAGEVTNDTFAPLRSWLRSSGERIGRRVRGEATLGSLAVHRPDVPSRRDARSALRSEGRFRSRRLGPPGSEGRWSLVSRGARRRPATETERRTALARILLERHGVLTREAVAAEGIVGGFGAVYEVLKAMEEAGRVRRGYFVAGLGATQFALPGADDRLRAVREPPEEPFSVVIAATDPANPYGAALPWPQAPGDANGSAEGASAPSAAPAPRAAATRTAGPRPQRAAGAHVVLVDGALAGFLGRGGRTLATFLPDNEPERTHVAQALVRALASLVDSGRRRALLISEIDGTAGEQSPLAPLLAAAAFSSTSRGWFRRAIK
jgi:ATP-dependent Lhr-like helicase